MSKYRIELKLHNFVINEILPMKDDDECCEAIESLNLKEGDYEITRTTMETELVDFSHTLSMFKHNKKKKKTKDVDGETVKGAPIEVIGEVIG